MTTNEQIIKGISDWVSLKIDELSSDNIWLALAANPIKRVAGEYMSKILPMDLMGLLFSSNGILDADVFANEIISSINNAPEVTQEFGGGYSITIKDGAISFIMPDNGITKAFLKGHNVINFREEDIRELAKCINNTKYV